MKNNRPVRLTQQVFTCPKSTIETLEKKVKEKKKTENGIGIFFSNSLDEPESLVPFLLLN